MKIKATQLTNTECNAIVKAVDYYALHISENGKGMTVSYPQLATRIKHGELILCEYQYNEQEKGGTAEDRLF